jgi:translation initiation factor 2 beta subunit (eIF-2beta)/eIF-5
MNIDESLKKYLENDYILNRAYKIYQENNLNNLNNSKNTSKICKPEISNHNRKTYITNFDKFCKSINRNPESVKKFIEKDMNASTSLISSNNLENYNYDQLKFNNLYKSLNIMKSIKNYMDQYVICNLCRSSNTEIKKINKVIFICCLNCKANKAI